MLLPSNHFKPTGEQLAGPCSPLGSIVHCADDSAERKLPPPQGSGKNSGALNEQIDGSKFGKHITNQKARVGAYRPVLSSQARNETLCDEVLNTFEIPSGRETAGEYRNAAWFEHSMNLRNDLARSLVRIVQKNGAANSRINGVAVERNRREFALSGCAGNRRICRDHLKLAEHFGGCVETDVVKPRFCFQDWDRNSAVSASDVCNGSLIWKMVEYPMRKLGERITTVRCSSRPHRAAFLDRLIPMPGRAVFHAPKYATS
jgi:hypothetical protein